jgi:hypothetical protein
MSDRLNATNSLPGSVFFSGLDNPRGLKFGPDGFLYVAEAGLGGTTLKTTAENCEQVPPPIGLYTAGPYSARISRIAPDGSQRTNIVQGLPSSQTSATSGGLVSGVADIAFVNDTLYALYSTWRGAAGIGAIIDALILESLLFSPLIAGLGAS